MPRRNSLNAIRNLGDLSHLGEIVVDKHSGQRAAAKKNRPIRHYEKQFIRKTLIHRAAEDAYVLPERTDRSTAERTLYRRNIGVRQIGRFNPAEILRMNRAYL
jgi:hypothetical protein